MKKKKIIMYLIMFLLGIFFLNNEVKAEKIYVGDYIKPTYYYKHKKGSYISYQTAQYIIRNSDGAFVYCVQPLLKVDENGNYQATENDIETLLNITSETWDTLMGIAYYGYGYNENGYNHTSSKWYVATQMLIWQKVDTSVESYFTSTLNGTKNDSILKSEMEEIMDLVNKHYVTPKFNNIPQKMNIGDSITLSDYESVLDKYNLTNINGGTVTKNGNEITITANKVGNISFSLQKLLNTYGERTKLYYVDGGQAVVNKGDLDPINVFFNISVTGGKVGITKVDRETLKTTPQGQASLKGAIYGIYQQDGTKVGELITDENGLANSDYLPEEGIYYLQEITPSKGYKLDSTRYSFTISENSLNPNVTVKEQVIKNRIKILKQYDFVDGDTKFLNAESGVTFEIYYPDGRKFSEITTDKNGYAEIVIPYGIWKFHQKNTHTGFEKIYDFYVTVDENSQEMQYYNILNNKISAYLQVLKVDSETGKNIAIKDTTFKIFNVDTNQYVSQYVGGKVYDEFTTDENGIMTTYLKLEAGNYKLIEVSSPLGYLLNLDDMSFTIGSDTHYATTTYGPIVTIRFANKPIKGQIEIHKKGESFIIDDGKYSYEEKPLKNVVYEIYAKEDILSSDKNTIYYKKDELVDRITTDNKGYAISKKLYLGTYYIVEVATDDEHILDSKEYVFTLKEENNTTPIVYVSYSAFNYLKKGTLEFTKTDLINGETISDTIIEIYTEDGNLIFTGKTDKEGKIVITDLKVGRYYILEKEPSTGYVITDEKVYFELKENGEIVKAEMKNKPIIGSLDFTKTDLVTGEPISNTIIEIYNKKNELVFIGQTDETGKIIIPELRYGEYYILEKEATTGYVLTDTIIYFEIKSDGETIKANMTNKKITGELDFTKVDFSNGTPLPHTLIEIYKVETNELVFSGYTDENGKIIIKGLEYGRYYILEKEAPESYKINEEKMFFEILEDGQIIKATMKDEKIDMPETYNTDLINYIEFGIIALVGIGILIYAKKKK